jgi:hypothetical protein
MGRPIGNAPWAQITDFLIGISRPMINVAA